MNIEDATVEIPSLPQPSSMAWLGGAAAAAGLSWLVTLVTVVALGPLPGHLVAAGLCVSVTISITAVSVWMRYSLAKAAGEHHQQLAHLLAGQHALLAAELRRNRFVVEEAAGRACIERQAISVKLTKVVEDMPTYWHGAADTIQQWAEADRHVRPLGPSRGPRP
jgi:hypothetical protein